MVSRQDIIKLLTLLLVASLLLVACERPLQNAGQTAEELATQVAEEAEQAEEGLDEEEATPEPEPEEEAEEEEVTPTEPAPTEAPTEVTEDVPDVTEESDAGEELDEEESPRTETDDEEEATETPEAEATEEGVGEADAEEPDAEETAEETEAEAEQETETEEEVDEAETETEAEAEEAEATEEEAEAETETTEEEEATTETQTETGAERTHVVQAGENLYRIGLQYGISWAVIADYNNISNPNSIFVGQELRIPPEEGQEPPDPTPTPSPATETTYIVRPGDNLYRIGRAFNISWVQIAEANGIVNPNQIVVGQELKIPAEAPGPAPQFTHTVRQGETLFTISLRYGVAWSTIAEANDLTSPYVIYPGQTLVIPGG